MAEYLIYPLIFISFLVSASCGMGGSLILIPAFGLLLGVKESIMMASLLLTLNNFVKLYFYRKHLILKDMVVLLALTIAGSAIGAKLLFNISDKLAGVILVMVMLFSFFFQQVKDWRIRKGTSSLLAFSSGFFSGIGGTSGPLKGLALKCHVFTKEELVAAASIVSMAGDTSKTIVYMGNALFTTLPFHLLLISIIIMPIATSLGRNMNRKLGRTAYDTLFYCVMSGYMLRFFL